MSSNVTLDDLFPDPHFRERVAFTLRLNAKLTGPNLLSALSQLTFINTVGRNITNANGLQYLTKLTTLAIANSQLTTINISHNRLLNTLLLTNNALTSLDVSHCPLLSSLRVSGNQLSSIDISQSMALIILDLSGNPKLEEVYMNQTQANRDRSWLWNWGSADRVVVDSR